MTVDALARPEIRRLQAYVTALQESESVRLNANETPWAPHDGGYSSSLNRYPEIRPLTLQRRLAEHYRVAPNRLLVTRGSSEGIDLLIRAFCRPGVDSIVVTPPTFSMYRVYADIQGAATLAAPLRAANDFEVDTGSVLAACRPNTKLIFVCSPNNPTGGLVPPSRIGELAEARKCKSLIVVDEAYAEFSGAESLTALLARYDNLVVLRTLSKALALAGARCGAVVGPERLVNLLNGILAPYAFATPVVDCVLKALAPANARASRDSINRIVRARERLAAELANVPDVLKVWPSRANFLLVRFGNLARVQAKLREERILIRDFGGEPELANCARITVGARAENDLLLKALGAVLVPA